MLTLNLVTLRPFHAGDLDFVVSARNDLSIEAASQPTEPRPISRAVFKARLEAGLPAVSSGGADDLEFVITRADDPAGAPLGIAGLYNVDRFNGLAEIGATIAAASARRNGIGIDTYLALARYGFTTLGLNKVYGFVKAGNEAGRGTCVRIGLSEEGVLREHRWIEGERVDLHVYGLLAREWDARLVDWRLHDAATAAAAAAAAGGTD
jgi:RimJ/RimL family protein N-acetyltransferase